MKFYGNGSERYPEEISRDERCEELTNLLQFIYLSMGFLSTDAVKRNHVEEKGGKLLPSQFPRDAIKESSGFIYSIIFAKCSNICH